MINKINSTIEFILNGTLFLIIALSPVGVINLIVEFNNDMFSSIFGIEPDTVMRILYIILPFIALNIIWWFLSYKLVNLIRQSSHKKFNGLWFSYNEGVLDVFLIYHDCTVKSLIKLIKLFKYERYDRKTEKQIHRGFTTLNDKIFHFDGKESENSVSVMIPICNHENPIEKMFVEICLHLHDKEFNYVSVHNIKNNENYKRVKIEKYEKSNELLKLIRKKEEFDNKYNEIIKEFLSKKKDKKVESKKDKTHTTHNKDEDVIVITEGSEDK